MNLSLAAEVDLFYVYVYLRLLRLLIFLKRERESVCVCACVRVCFCLFVCLSAFRLLLSWGCYFPLSFLLFTEDPSAKLSGRPHECVSAWRLCCRPGSWLLPIILIKQTTGRDEHWRAVIGNLRRVCCVEPVFPSNHSL